MTISEQLREAALYAEIPAFELRKPALDVVLDFESPNITSLWIGDDARTFLLIVAEALE